MSSAPDGQAASPHQDIRASEIKVLADKLVAFVEEFETALNKGHVPPAFAERLAQFPETADRIFDAQAIDRCLPFRSLERAEFPVLPALEYGSVVNLAP